MPTPIDLDKLRSIGVISRRTHDQVKEGRDGTGERYKATKDELGNVVTERGLERQDVQINAPHIHKKSITVEERN